ncbi:MAG: copper resistance protein NlpE N-terminal domain-containing protein [Prolixibacteraceae bacterium]|jgi:copper homeostasis protein (lipoprotein)|nr:copper resistance protein NlpE N-terminal domain-containing protein [Prolixibacteraceae bacterium]
MKNSFFLVLFIIALAGCSVSKKMASESVSLELLTGTYAGVLPCADCEGIETLLTLGANGEFRLETRYLGVDDGENTFVSEGFFKQSDDGKLIILNVEGEDSRFNQYMVDENRLVKLDSEGRRIEGEMADMYVLEKKIDLLTETKFMLLLLEGKEIDSGRVYFTLSNDENRFYGQGFCNSFNGQFLLKGHDVIKFNNLASTKMACPEIDAENKFFSMLKQIDSYRLEGKTLLLKSSDNVRAVFSAE